MFNFSTLKDEFLRHLRVFEPVYRGLCKDRTHTVNDDYQLLKLKIKNEENHLFLFSFFPAPNFFPKQSFTCFPTTTAGGGE